MGSLKKKIKTMNIKIAINSQLSIIESKKLSKALEQGQKHRYGGHLQGFQLRGGRGRMGENVHGLRSTNWQVQNRQGEVKNLYAQPMDRN